MIDWRPYPVDGQSAGSDDHHIYTHHISVTVVTTDPSRVDPYMKQ